MRTIVKRVYQSVDAAVEMKPDALVIIDSPEFTHPIARRVRRRLPAIPVINYVSPTVWNWRPGRARKMRGYIDHVLAILPFEPAAHERLGGPDCSYAGHPLIERLEWIESLDPAELAASLGVTTEHPVVAVLPGSRSNEVKRVMDAYGDALRRVMETSGPLNVIIPVVPSVEELIREGIAKWPVIPHLITGEEKKFQAFRLADAALATSGTVTLELALAGTPMVVAYRTEPIVAMFRWVAKAHSIVLPNLILEENVFPEFFQEACSAENLSDALLALLDRDGAQRKRQIDASRALASRMKLASGSPSDHAAKVILSLIRQ
ncbi:MAG TPA: lipid-A-disaccharide synthase [Rhizobiales bacterium]|nr:lipid-A-disaccharide synthase [Hyphomicrobiales bacterium]